MNKIEAHPILDNISEKEITIYYNDKPIKGLEGQTIAALLLYNGIKTLRYTKKRHEPRSVFCCNGQCYDCVMVVNGKPNVRTCVTLAEEGMSVETQEGCGDWSEL